jgi:nucleoid DNA-binding protein
MFKPLSLVLSLGLVFGLASCNDSKPTAPEEAYKTSEAAVKEIAKSYKKADGFAFTDFGSFQVTVSAEEQGISFSSEMTSFVFTITKGDTIEYGSASYISMMGLGGIADLSYSSTTLMPRDEFIQDIKDVFTYIKDKKIPEDKKTALIGEEAATAEATITFGNFYTYDLGRLTNLLV